MPHDSQDPVAREYDAGDRGCGEIVMELRIVMRSLAPGAVLRLVARDRGAPEDLPAWCRMTGHTLAAGGASRVLDSSKGD